MTMTRHLTQSLFDRYDIVSSRALRSVSALVNGHTSLGFQDRLAKEMLADRDNHLDLAIANSPHLP